MRPSSALMGFGFILYIYIGKVWLGPLEAEDLILFERMFSERLSDL